MDAEAGEAVGETAVQTVTDGPENPGQNGTANGNALPRKLPPLQPHELSEEVKHLNVILIYCLLLHSLYLPQGKIRWHAMTDFFSVIMFSKRVQSE